MLNLFSSRRTERSVSITLVTRFRVKPTHHHHPFTSVPPPFVSRNWYHYRRWLAAAVTKGGGRKGKERKIKRRKSTFSSLAPLCSRIRDAKHKGGLPAPPVAYKPGLTFHPPRPIVFLPSFLPPPPIRVANGTQSKVNVGQVTDRKFPTRIATRARIIQGGLPLRCLLVAGFFPEIVSLNFFFSFSFLFSPFFQGFFSQGCRVWASGDCVSRLWCLFLERYGGIGLGPESDGKLLGIIRGGKKVRFVDIRGRNYGLSASISGIVFNLIRIFIFCNVSFCKSMHFK